MVLEVDSPVINADIERQHKEQFYAGIEALILEEELRNKQKKKTKKNHMNLTVDMINSNFNL
jgi:hypothetical protein